MTATEFAEYLSGSAALSNLSAATLAEYVAKYPYSAPLQAMLLKKYQSENQAAFTALLPATAAMAADRQQLYDMLYTSASKPTVSAAFVSQKPPRITAIELGIMK
jgi:hypothetical protein